MHTFDDADALERAPSWRIRAALGRLRRTPPIRTGWCGEEDGYLAAIEDGVEYYTDRLAEALATELLAAMRGGDVAEADRLAAELRPLVDRVDEDLRAQLLATFRDHQECPRITYSTTRPGRWVHDRVAEDLLGLAVAVGDSLPPGRR